jgi:hypothetical protein
MRKSSTKAHVRLDNGKRGVLHFFNVAQHDFLRTFHVIRNFHAAGIVMGLPWLDDEQATLKFGTERLFTLMDAQVITFHFLFLITLSYIANGYARACFFCISRNSLLRTLFSKQIVTLQSP